MMQPGELGAPPNLSTWRPQQAELFTRLLGSGRRIDVAAAATGVGKSLIGWSYAKLMGARTVFLTSTNILMKQYQRDFVIPSVMGMGRYQCLDIETGYANCDQGKCLDGESCQLKDGGCLYYDAVRNGAASDLVITNYDYWMTHAGQKTLGERDLLIADEAHGLPERVAKFAGARFGPHEVDIVPSMEYWPLETWKEWGLAGLMEYEDLLSRESRSLQRRELRSMAQRFAKVAHMDEGWAWDATSRGLQFEPIEPGGYTEGLLWQGMPKVVLLSATIRPTELRGLGVPDHDFHFFEVGSPFPIERRPVYWVEVGFRLNAKTSETNLLYWVSRIDQIIEKRQDRKGLIHTVSYARAKFLKKHSRFARQMVVPRGDELLTAVQEFRTMGAGAILVSPAIHTGHDFPYEDAEYQVIAKVPFPDTRQGIAAARQARDPQWSIKHAAATIVQMAGRVVRAEDDAGETFITDDSMGFLYDHNRNLFPKFFQEAYRKTLAAPPPPPRLGA